jgi:hypothetical protein
MILMSMTLSTNARSVSSPTQDRRRDSQTTDSKNNADKKEVNGDKERANTQVDREEQLADLGDNEHEGDKLAEARDEQLEDNHEDSDAVMVRGRHATVAVPRAREEASQVPIRAGEQRDDVVAGPTDGSHRDGIVGDGGVFGGRRNISTCQTMRR